MIATNRQAARRSTLVAVIAASLVVAALPSLSGAEVWELRTAYKEVPGTREIESGNAEKAIRISKVYLPRAKRKLKVAVLTNLCVGHILIRDFDQAEQYCDQAVARPNERVVSHNNRGVLKALQGDYKSAQRDFSIAADAGCINSCDAIVPASGNRPRHVALRNLDRTGLGVPDAGRIMAREDR